jgi:hypothetical protein
MNTTTSLAQSGLWGLMAEFDSAQSLVDASEKVRLAGYTKTDGYSPFPIPEIDEALGIKKTKLPWIIFFVGLTACCSAFTMQWFANVIHYPINIGGRPTNSWPMFIPITFELTILCSALTTAFGMAIANSLPWYYHPAFNVPSFVKATSHGFFLTIESADKNFDLERTREFLKSLNPVEVSDVAP